MRCVHHGGDPPIRVAANRVAAKQGRSEMMGEDDDCLRLGDASDAFPPAPEGAISRREILKRGTAVGAALALSGGILSGQAQAAGTAAPKRGGHLRVADPGGGTSETLDPQKSLNLIDELRDR